ncbi:MAG: hypothetical protein HFI93_08560 [Lachnospiraceae bacterium]|nr:hypothetical protein [Lachnospiraceae bacterium]
MKKHKRKKLVSFILSLMLCMGTGIQAYAMETNVLNLPNVSLVSEQVDEGIVPLWDNTSDVYLALSFDGNTAYCSLDLNAYSWATKIKANVWLYRDDGDGTWTTVRSWTNMVVYRDHYSLSGTYSPVYKGETYKLYFSGQVYAADGTYDSLSLRKIVTY